MFGSIIVFGLLLQVVSRLTAKVYSKPFGWKAIYLFGWLGTPIHELGHAFFCLLFRHKIEKIALFEPDRATGKLGYVRHTYYKDDLIAQVGNFFIGVGPLIFGTAALFMVFYFLVPAGAETWSILLTEVREITSGAQNSTSDYFYLFVNLAFDMVRAIFTVSNLADWRFWVYLYLSVSIASHMGVSIHDLRSMARGLVYLLPTGYVLFFLVNLSGIVSGWGAEYFVPLWVSATTTISGVMMLALAVSLLGLVLSYVIIATCGMLRRGIS